MVEFKTKKEGANYGFWVEEQLVGLFTINKIDWNTQVADVGYWLIKTATGKGLAFSGLCSLRDSLQNFGFIMLTASTAISNSKSQRLLVKAGFKKDKILERNITVGDKVIDEILFTCRLKF